jgi:nucleotide-binding universal stress UspA family protein
MKVLVGFDDSEGAWDAITLTRVLCELLEVEPVLVQVLFEEDLLAVPYRVLELEHFDDVDPLEPAREAFAGLDVSTRSYVGGSAGHVLHDLAESEDVELIVIGSPRREALGRAFLGSVGEALLHGASRPLLVAPRGYAAQAHEKPRVIAVAYDGTRESKLALEHAEALAARAGARIRVLTVRAPAVPIPSAVGYGPPPIGFEPQRLIEEAIAAVHSVEAEGRELSGAPAAALAEACEEDVDLLVAGSRGYGPLGRLFVGSVTSKLICRAPCPVLVVPRPQGQAPESPASAAGAGQEVASP